MHFYSLIRNFLSESFPLKTVPNRNNERIDRSLMKKTILFLLRKLKYGYILGSYANIFIL